MQLSVTFRHMEGSDALKEHAREKLDKIKKYFPDPIMAHVVLSTERGYQHCADVNIQLHNGLTIKGSEATEDMYSSIDLVMAKIERQVRRYKEKIRGHKGSDDLSSIPIQVSVLTEEEATTGGDGDGAHAQAPRSSVVHTEHIPARTLSVDEALMQLNLGGGNFLVFRNSQSSHVNVVYRRDDGKYGLIETGVTAASP
jgi:putative sigma-54 modulation protein